MAKKKNPIPKKAKTSPQNTSNIPNEISHQAPKTVETSPTNPETSKPALAFDAENYYFMFGGILLLFVGLWIMSIDNEPFGFGFFGLTLGPLLVFISFMVQFVAIFYKKKRR